MKTAKASAGSVSETSGRVWIWVEEAIPTLQETIRCTKLKVVDELIDATVLRTSDAEQVTRKANQEYSKYLWRAVPAERGGECVVQGDLRADT